MHAAGSALVASAIAGSVLITELAHGSMLVVSVRARVCAVERSGLYPNIKQMA
jgi:hypothetical protein